MKKKKRERENIDRVRERIDEHRLLRTKTNTGRFGFFHVLSALFSMETIYSECRRLMFRLAIDLAGNELRGIDAAW